MIHRIGDLLSYDEVTELWCRGGDWWEVEGRMSREVALELIEYIRRCEANAAREFGEVVRLFEKVCSLSPSGDPSYEGPPSSVRSRPAVPT